MIGWYLRGFRKRSFKHIPNYTKMSLDALAPNHSHHVPSSFRILKGSVGPYWWPDPSKPDGLPYIRKDGHKNPERGKIGDSGLSPVFWGIDQFVARSL